MVRITGKIAVATILMLVGLEGLLRFFPLPDPYEILRSPETKRVHRFLPGWNAFTGWFGKTPPFSVTFITGPLTGVSTKQVKFTVNRYGFPYEEARAVRKMQDELRIGVVGGSTVECSALEQGRRWPDVLERILSERKISPIVTVLNLGVSGQDTRTHLATVSQHAVKLDLDYLVFMLGANDLSRTDPEDLLYRDDAFVVHEDSFIKPFLMRLQLFRRLRVAWNQARGTEYYVEENGTEQTYFAVRVREKLRLPVLQSGNKEPSANALDDYEQNIVSLAALAGGHGITPVFTTQPMLWKAVMSDREEQVDWLVGTVVSEGFTYRLPSSQMEASLEMLNHRLLDTCSRRHLRCIDLDKKIPRSLQSFYDSLHLNEAGAVEVARYVADYIASDLASSAAIAR
jgi:lysophospholipase L1-like esterase